jgi:GT2 family glycosyltransferase
VLENTFTAFDLYVVDNASTDDSVARIRAAYGNTLTLIENAENLGGSGGFNAGLRAALAHGYPYVMCIDNDALLDENAIGALYDFLEHNPDVGMAASRIDHMECPDYVQNYGQMIDFDHFSTVVPYLNHLEDGTLPDVVYPDGVPACSLMVRSSTIDAIGLMPEENFLYWDDTEWCYRCWLSGRKVASVGASIALHAMGAKKEAVNTFPTYYAWRNWIRFFVKFTPEEYREQMSTTFLKSIFDVLYSGQYKNEHNTAQTVMRAYEDAVRGITGKAGADRIFDVDFNETPFCELFASSDTFVLDTGDCPNYEPRIKHLADKLGYSIKWLTTPTEGVPTITLCESIFKLQMQDENPNHIYVDIDDCILRTHKDWERVQAYKVECDKFLGEQRSFFDEIYGNVRG